MPPDVHETAALRDGPHVVAASREIDSPETEHDETGRHIGGRHEDLALAGRGDLLEVLLRDGRVQHPRDRQP